MVGIILVAHAPLASAMKQVAEHIIGPLPELVALDIGAQADVEQMRQALADKVIAVNEGQGVVIVTDIYGGAPSNIALSLQSDAVRVISGMNVPMLVKLVRQSQKSLDEAVLAATEAGVDFILNA